MEDNITRGEFAAEVKRIDDENNRQNHRIDALEKVVDKINDLAGSIKEMTVSMGGMQKELEKQGQKLDAIEAEPADKWRALTKTVLTVLASAVIGYVVAKIGLS